MQRAELPEGHYRAELLIVVATVLWGSTFPALKVLLGDTHYSVVLIYRFTVATFFLMGAYLTGRSLPSWAEWKAGMVLGVLLYMGNLTQIVGLQYTTASKSAFITCMTVVFVPLASILMERKLPRRSSVVGVIVATLGLYILTQPEGNGINPGDIWTLGCSIILSIYIVQLQIETQRHRPLSLLFVQFAVMTVTCWGAAIVGIFQGEAVNIGQWPGFGNLALLLYLALPCTLLATGLQTYFQRGTTATRAALIFTVEPIAATVIAWACITERMTLTQAVGAAIVLAGVLYVELFPDRKAAVVQPGRSKHGPS